MLVVATAAFAILLSVLSLMLCMGFMREVVALREQIFTLTEMLTVPPVPEYVSVPGGLPRPVAQLIEGVMTAGERHAVLFVSDTCPSCQDLVNGILENPNPQLNSKISVVFTSEILEPKPGSFSNMLQDQGVHVHFDYGGPVFASARIVGTPTALVIEAGTVVDFSAGLNYEWLKGKMQVDISDPSRLPA